MHWLASRVGGGVMSPLIWHWHLREAERGKCKACNHSHPAPDVNWDGYLYHVGCLLDKLAAEPRLDVDLSNWSP